MNEVKEIIERETRAWNERNVELLLSIFHPDMVWVWPSDRKNLDPLSWQSFMGKFDHARWSKSYFEWFAKFDIVRNKRETKKVQLTEEGDGAFAVVDIDTLWRSKSGEESHWWGRTGKTYVRTPGGWKMIAQVGVFETESFAARV